MTSPADLGLAEHTIDANGIQIHFVEMGEGPLVVFCHGWPESWYSWRHQLPVVAEAGYRAVALSMRGYGGTSVPQAVGAYSMSHLVGDVVGVVNALGVDSAVVVGHDWGAPVAWYSALMRPDLFRAVAALSVPFPPPIGALPEGITMTALMEANAGPDRDYYRLYFGRPDEAEADFEADVARSLRGLLYTLSGDAVADGHFAEPWDGHFPKGQSMTAQFGQPESLPHWLTEDDLAFYTAEMTRTGFGGGFNWYRNLDRLPEILAPWVGTTIEQPAMYMAGSVDLLAGNTPDNLAVVQALPDLRHYEIIEGAGHWLQQERPRAVNTALVDFLDGLR